MKRLPLGQSGLTVSEFCLGTMTFGNQTGAADAHAQIDAALAAGVNFIDTAEMYPTQPVRAETVGRTEEIIGDWLAKSGRRGEVVLATKLTGPGQKMVRDGAPVTGATLVAAAEASLRRLQTDVIDLYQIHWPSRGSYHFRQNWGFSPARQDRAATVAHMTEMLQALQGLVQAGKVRAFGLSNESAWGTALWLRLAEENGLPRVASVQNEYSLLCRLADTDMAELCHNEDVALLAFSPLGAGLLTGKYAGGAVPAGSRKAATPDLGGRVSPRVDAAVAAYHAVAQRHGLDPAQMALAWTRARPFPVIPILGATTLGQLEQALGAAGMILAPEVMADLDATHRAHPMPY